MVLKFTELWQCVGGGGNSCGGGRGGNRGSSSGADQSPKPLQAFRNRSNSFCCKIISIWKLKKITKFISHRCFAIENSGLHQKN